MHRSVTVTLPPGQAALLLKFCAAEEKKLNRKISRLNTQINVVYNTLYDLSDLSSSVTSAQRDEAAYEEAYSYYGD